MRKRNKASRGSRALTSRRGGNSRVPGNRTDSSSSNNRGGRGGGRGKSPVGAVTTATTGSSSHPPNGVFKPAIPERYCRNGISVSAGSTAAAMLSISSSVASDFYLHKKFKKIADVSDDNAGGTGSTTSEDDWKGSKKEEQSQQKKPSTPVKTSTSTSGSVPSTKSQASSEQNSTSSGSTTVYKPKFRLVEASNADEKKRPTPTPPPPPPVETPVAPPPSSTPSPPTQQSSSKPKDPSKPEEQKIVPGKINGERMDRQSLDDRISKIIDENQSILASITEPWGKKHRSRQSSLTTSPLPADLSTTTTSQRNGLVIMSGGSTERPTNAFSPVTTLRPSGVEARTALPPTTMLIRSHSDAGGQVIPAAEPKNSERPASAASSSSNGSSSTVVPKKRRRLSPTPNRLCGGEVAELPAVETPIVTTKSPYQDVDMTVRVSKCGTSGAKVTIRTTSGQTAASYSRLLDVPSSPSPLKFQQPSPPELPRGDVLLVHTGGSLVDQQQSQSSSSSSSPSRYSPASSDLRGKQPPRPFKKGRVELLGTESPNAAGTCGPTSPVPSVIVNAAMKLPPPSSPSTTPKQQRAQVSPPTPTKAPLEVAAVIKKEVEEPSEVSKTNMSPPPLLLQSSAPNPKRPNFLALKPVNPWPKKPDPGVLPSPETPRGARTYNQMYINGQAYTYLGFKVSTRSSYTCLFKQQPTFLPQEVDPKLSMYSNWQPRSRNKSQEEFPISLNDSRVNGRKSPRSFLYTLAGQKCVTDTVDSPDKNKTFVSTILPEVKVPATPTTSSQSLLSIQALEEQPSPRPASSQQGSSAQPLTVPSPRKTEPGHLSNSKPLNLAAGSSKQPSAVAECNNSPRLSGPMIEAISSCSSSGSADESMNLTVESFKERAGRRSNQDSMRPLALVAHNDSQDTASRESIHEMDDDRSSSSYGHFDNPRVRIMEGGFESNEDYTYVRGRGRGRYVCEACGIRCKKPSMLRKHLKTHTDLRPYTCKLCNFSFKTKGNLTKHQKSKSHHKKCLGLGIHPESQRSLAMIGPQGFSDTNTTDESDDEDDAGCYNGDTDSQDEIDPDDVSSSAEPEMMNGTEQSHSFEKEIAQSLLDLSKVGRVSGNNNNVAAIPGVTKMTESPSKVAIPSRPNGMRIPDESSSSPESNTVEAPMDLSCRGKPNESDSDMKRLKLDKNAGQIRSFGVVSEAQKWEPEDEFMITGCLNLKKVPNDNGNTPKNGSSGSNGAFSRVNGAIAMIQPPADVKPEVRAFHLNNNVGEKAAPSVSPYEFQLGKRKRESSTSSTGYNEPVNFANSPKHPSTSGLPPPPANQVTPKPQKLHQPWLSPEESKPAPPPPPPEVIVKQDVDSPRKSPSAESSYEQKVLDPCDLNREHGLGVPVDLQRPPASLSPTPKVFPGLAGLKPQAEFREPSGPQALVKDEGKAECNVCGKVFARASQLSLHMNIHYLERPYRCDPCGVSFRTKGHLIKHRRSSSHDCKVKVCLNDSWGVANEENPRPFKCPDCKIAFRIHGHLAKHLRSKMHIMRMECLGKLPFGIYFEMEKCGLNLTEIDTSDCDMSLISLQGVAKKIYGDSWKERLTVPMEEAV